MTGKTAPSKTVFSNGELVVRGTAALIDGVAVRGAKVLPDQRESSATHGVVNELYMGEHCHGLLRIPPGVLHGWMCVGETEAYIISVVSEMYDYAQPDEFRIDPHDNDIPYQRVCKDG